MCRRPKYMFSTAEHAQHNHVSPIHRCYTRAPLCAAAIAEGRSALLCDCVIMHAVAMIHDSCRVIDVTQPDTSPCLRHSTHAGKPQSKGTPPGRATRTPERTHATCTCSCAHTCAPSGNSKQLKPTATVESAVLASITILPGGTVVATAVDVHAHLQRQLCPTLA